ncbi:chemotaxis protein CheW [Halapricum sp. CBA1109]|uniref:chemotaxis protein CheW n=1 Tax=Halapricum sp. CBA1109 TaxID=2668068 RepID=UPI0012F9670C|nr:chemotaxis protein CheW [Halapricum sp. CBA1109]MUV88957.1 chemotaxis protein CheW [Halapricum sp. CBA1109]
MSGGTATVDAPEQVLVFSLGADRFCVGIDRIDEIVEADTVSSLPGAPPLVEGVMNLRGETTTVIDPSSVLDGDSTATTRQVIIFDTDDDRKVGWLVDRVHRVEDLADPETEPVEDNQYVEGILQTDDGFVLWVAPGPVHSRLD